MFQRYAELDVDCVLFSAYADDPMFGIQAQGYAASHSYWVSVSVPTQMSHGLSSRLIAPTGEVQAAATPSVSGLVVDLLDERLPALGDRPPPRQALAGHGTRGGDLSAIAMSRTREAT